ncbi:IS1182 family transposase [Kitasatospora sp. RB6PN24]|uniref:IS1182 family transposase n=1 Tax=Kitasatospora humi TaxID=2893891 RepID=UPI001E615BE6|nr:IS1182 family transposase [Kitasatospora humi]MCC9306126.1 IS1182 family transposase [Kitasatospora humi]
MRAAGLPEVPEQTELVAAAAFPKGTLAMRAREKLAEVFSDEPFASAFGVRGAPGLSPGMLALVTVLQFAENLTDRQAAGMAVRAIDWKYALGLELTDPGFDFTVLAKFRARLVEHGMERLIFDRLVEHCRQEGLIAAGGKQRTDSTHVISAVRDLNRLELAGESVRAALEALAAAAATWLAQAVPVAEWELRYAARVDSWRLPSSKTKRDRLAEVYGQDALALLHAIHAPAAPVWLREIEAVQLLRRIFMQTYYVHTDARGREVVRKREAEVDGVPPGHLRLASPYDRDARWSAKGDELFWSGYKVHLTETCDDTFDGALVGVRTRTPNLITDVVTTASTAPDVTATAGIQQRLTERQVKPGEHYLDSGYPSADLVTAAAHDGIAMITPLLADHSRQARAAEGFDKSAFRIDWTARQVHCPEGRTSTGWYPVQQHGHDAIVIEFARSDCDTCPSRNKCTTAARGNRMLTLRPRELHETVATARAEQKTDSWQTKYALRAGVEGTINQALDVTGLRRARYRGLPKTSLQHAYSATAINVIRLDAHWAEDPRRPRTSRLSQLAHQLAA